MIRSTSRVLLAVLVVIGAIGALAWGLLRWTGYELSLVPGTVASKLIYSAGSLSDGSLSAESLSDSFDFAPRPESERPKNLVVLLADGLGFAHLAAARTALAGSHGRLTLERFPVTSWHTTFSRDGMYTDSGAGGTALATGVLTTPGFLSVDSEGRPVSTLMEEALAAGKSAAVITDSYLWDASPAAWLVHHDNRRHYDEVARQMAASGVTLALGEALPSSDAAAIEAHLKPFRDHGFTIVQTASDVAAALGGEGPVVGLFASGSVSSPDAPPELADLAELALRRLASNPNGFVLFVESEEIDSGSHNGDLDRVIRGIGTLDETARRVLRFARDRDDTLVVFTGDHETGGLALANVKGGEPLQAMWAWSHHTGAPVPILAWGAGAEQLMGVHENTDVGRILRGLLATDPAATDAAAAK